MLIKFGEFKQEYYQGIFEKAAFSLHRDIIRLASPFLNKDQKVVDVGCGEGAFSQRLADMGLNVDSCDIDTDQIKAKVSNKLRIDLNLPNFSDNFSRKYDVACTIEIIEHIENPWKFLRDVSSILNEKGIIILSTPNVSAFTSRLRFLMRGTLLSFEKEDLHYGHITPIPFSQLEHMFGQCGLKVLQKGHGGIIPIFQFSGLSRFTILRNTLLPLFLPFMSGPKHGRALIYILQKL